MADNEKQSRFGKIAEIAFWALASGGLLLVAHKLVFSFVQWSRIAPPDGWAVPAAG